MITSPSLIIPKEYKTHLILPDSHSHPSHSNDRFDWFGQLLADVKPDVFINIGDNADLPSLSTYDKGKRSFQGRNYKADIDAHLDAQDRTFAPIRRLKKKLPASYFFEGNHEHRITRAIDLSPELDGAMSFRDLRLGDYYDEVVNYSGGTPGVKQIDGIHYSHYFVGGIAGRPLGGIHAGYAIATKKFASATCGHSHLLDFSHHVNLYGNSVNGLTVGCAQDYTNDWAGEIGNLWWRGVVIKRNVDGSGAYDPQFISLDALRREYAGKTSSTA